MTATETEYEVLNLHHNDNTGNVYVFPDPEDCCWIDKDDITFLSEQPEMLVTGKQIRYVFTSSVSEQ